MSNIFTFMFKHGGSMFKHNFQLGERVVVKIFLCLNIKKKRKFQKYINFKPLFLKTRVSCGQKILPLLEGLITGNNI